MNDWLVMEIYAKFHESVSICTPLTLTNQVFKTKPFFCTSTGLHGSDCLWISTEKLPCNWKRCNVLKDEATSYGKRSYSMANYLSPPPMRLGHHCVELYINKAICVYFSYMSVFPSKDVPYFNQKLWISCENHLVMLCFGWARCRVVWRRKTEVVFGGEILENTEGERRLKKIWLPSNCCFLYCIWEVLWKWETG